MKKIDNDFQDKKVISFVNSRTEKNDLWNWMENKKKLWNRVTQINKKKKNPREKEMICDIKQEKKITGHEQKLTETKWVFVFLVRNQ